MLTTFSSLLFLQLLAPTFLRIGVGLLLVFIGYQTLTKNFSPIVRSFSNEKYPVPIFLTLTFGILEVVCGLFLLAGFLTQITSLVVIYMCINIITLRSKIHQLSIVGSWGLALIVLICFTLLLTGAGLYGVDVPF